MIGWKVDKDQVQDHTNDAAKGEEKCSQRDIVKRWTQEHNAWVSRWYDGVNYCITDIFVEENEGHGDGDE